MRRQWHGPLSRVLERRRTDVSEDGKTGVACEREQRRPGVRLRRAIGRLTWSCGWYGPRCDRDRMTPRIGVGISRPIASGISRRLVNGRNEGSQSADHAGAFDATSSAP